MRRLTHSLGLAGVLLCFLAAPAYSQQKIGYVNTDEILNHIPEYKGIQQQLTVVSKDWRRQLDDMQQRIDTLRAEYKAKKILLTDQVRADKRHKIDQLVEERKQFLSQKFGPDGQYFQKQKELLKPIQRKIFEAIQTVAQQENVDFVFDRAKNSSLLFGRKQWDLNEKVLQELGISLDNNK